MAILLARKKLFSPYVERKFNGTPQRISLILFGVCFRIDFPFAFSFQVKPLGSLNTTEQNATATFYFSSSSDFSVSPFGKILLGLTTFFLNLFLSLVVDVILNIFSLNQFKSYAVKRRREVGKLQQANHISRM